MNFHRNTLLTLIFILITFSSDAQSYLTNLTSYSVEDGLSNRFVNAFFEDSKGFVWLATQNGLNRFDGYQFDFFMTESEEISSSNCMAIVEDVYGRIWPRFLNVKNPQQHIYHHYIDEYLSVRPIDDILPDTLNFTANDIYMIKQGMNNILYILTYDGTIYQYDGTFKIIICDQNIIDCTIHIESNTNDIYLVNSKYIKVIKQQGQLVETDSTFLKKGNFDDRIKIIYFNSAISYIKEKNKLPAISEKIKQLCNRLKSSPNQTKVFQVEYLCNNENGYYIIQSDDFLGLYDANLTLIFDFTASIQEKFDEIPSSSCYMIRENQIWLTNQDGFYIIDYQKNRFKQYFNDKSSYSTRGILELQNGHILTLSYKGVKEINCQSDEIKSWPIKSISAFRRGIELEDNSCIFGTYGGEIYHFNPITEEGRFISLKKDLENRLEYKGFLIPFQDSNKTIWVTSYKGLLTYNPQIDALELFDNYNQYSSLKNENVFYFQEDEAGIWMSSSDGLFLMDTVTGVKAHYPILSNLNIHHFYREGDVFWLATQKGLIKWNIKTKQLSQYNINNGMLDDYLMAVYPDTMGNLWLTSEIGLIKFNKKTANIHTFLESDGITHNEFNKASHFQAEDGQIFFGGLNGITTFYPADIEIKPKPKTSFSVTSYSVFDEAYGDFLDHTSQMLENNKIVLAPHNKSFKLSFALLTYQNIQQIRYSYKLEGLDKSWILQKENNVRFSRLPYGQYSLKIKAQDYTGEEVAIQLSIPLEVIAPFYLQTKWQIIGLFFLGVFCSFIVRWRIYQIQKEKIKLKQLVEQRTAIIEAQNQELQQVNEMKDRLFAILAHDLRNPLDTFRSISKSINYLLKNGDLSRLARLAKFIEGESVQFYHLLNNLLNWVLSQKQELALKPYTLDLRDVVEQVLDIYGSSANSIGVDLINHVPPYTLVIADSQALETVFRNLVSNALKYIPPNSGWVRISAKRIGKHIQIQVEDNGKGIAQNRLNDLFELNKAPNISTKIGSISFGLHLCREIIQLLEGTISVQSQVNKGTIFTIQLPFGVQTEVAPYR